MFPEKLATKEQMCISHDAKNFFYYSFKGGIISEHIFPQKNVPNHTPLMFSLELDLS